MICKRNSKVILKQGLWFIFWLQLLLLGFVAISLWHEETRSTIFKQLESGTKSFLVKDAPELPDDNEEEDDQDPEGQYKFRNFDTTSWETSQQVDLTRVDDDAGLFFKKLDGNSLRCFIPGTDLALSRDKCTCLPNYFGRDCGIPEAVWFGHFAANARARKKLVVRKSQRRIVHAVLVHHEFDFFEARVRMLQDVVDVFLVQESNFTTFGTSKDLLFLDRFKDGWLKDQQQKMLYVLLTHFTEKGKENGWYADAYIRRYITRHGLPMIRGLRDDDLFLLLDADELPTPEVLQFLKLYDGYSEPIRFGFRWTIFGFYWLKATDPSLLANMPLLGPILGQTSERLLQLYVMSTIGMLREVYGNNGMLLRRNVWKDPLLRDKVKNYTRSGLVPHRIREWDIGTLGHYAGYHCSWCYTPEGIRTKLLSAQKHDKPRWGDYPEKTNLTYIEQLIRTGGWFDDTKPFIAVTDQNDPFYAPTFFRDRPDRFGYLLEKPGIKP